MYRRVSLVCAMLIVALVGLSACTAAPEPKNPGQYVEMPGWTPAPLVTDAPDSDPSSADNMLVVVSNASIVTSEFTTPASVVGWRLSDDLSYAVITIGLSEADWRSFAKQAGFDSSKNPAAVQLNEQTARSLIDVDGLAKEVMKEREARKQTPIDIRTIEAYYDIQVLNH